MISIKKKLDTKDREQPKNQHQTPSPPAIALGN